MKIKLTPQNVANLKPQDKAYRVYDTYQPGLFIRVLPSGHASYMVTWAVSYTHLTLPTKRIV